MTPQTLPQHHGLASFEALCVTALERDPDPRTKAALLREAEPLHPTLFVTKGGEMALLSNGHRKHAVSVQGPFRGYKPNVRRKGRGGERQTLERVVETDVGLSGGLKSGGRIEERSGMWAMVLRGHKGQHNQGSQSVTQQLGGSVLSTTEKPHSAGCQMMIC